MSDEAEVTGTAGSSGMADMAARVDAALSEPPPAALADATTAPAPDAPVNMPAAGGILDSVAPGSFAAIILATEDLRAQLKKAQELDYKPLIYVALQRLDSAFEAAREALERPTA